MLFHHVLAASINLNDKAAIRNACKKGADRLISYYPDSSDGAIPQNGLSDSSGIQWYESGIMWFTYAVYTQLSQDSSFVQTWTGAVANASYGETADFLGPGSFKNIASTLLGKWNDDIAWWNFGPVIALELFGMEARMPNNVRFIELVLNTYENIWQQWDTSTCGGGIFWSRDRNSKILKEMLYKSTITNSQYVYMSAKLYSLTRNETYLNRARSVYDWLKRTQLITNDWDLLDGLMAGTTCSFNEDHYVYNPGILAAGLAYLFKATNNTSYMTDAIRLYNTAVQNYAPNNIWTDWCEQNRGPSCQPNQATSKGAALLGFTILYSISTDSKFKQDYKVTIDASMKAMLPQCDDQFFCANTWLLGGGSKDFHTQLNAVSLLLANLVVYDASLQSRIVPPTVEISKDGDARSGSGYKMVPSVCLLIACYLFF